MRVLASGMVLAAALTAAGCKDKPAATPAGGSAATLPGAPNTPAIAAAQSGAAVLSPAVTSPVIDQLLAGVPGNAVGLAFVDLAAPPWDLVTGGMIPLDAAARTALDKELRDYISKHAGVDLSKLQHAVMYVAGPPPSVALVAKAVSGTPLLPNPTDVEGAKLWVVDQSEKIALAMKGDLVIVGQEVQVRAVLETLAGKRKSVVAENKPLVDWLHEQTPGAVFGFAGIVPPGLPLPPEVAGIQRIAGGIGRTGASAVVEGDDATITKLQGMADMVIGEMLAQSEQARQAAHAGTLPPPEGAIAILGAAYAKSYADMLKPTRTGNRLRISVDISAVGTTSMVFVSAAGILAAVAIPAFMDFRKKAQPKSPVSLNLNIIGKNATTYFAYNSAFPKGTAALTPAKACCEFPDHECPVDSTAWEASVWKDLDFSVYSPQPFQYRYLSDGKTALVEAIGDLDCDGKTITYSLNLTSANGTPTMTLTEPPAGSD